MLFINIAILVVVGLVTWWITGLDKTFGGEGKHHHHVTRSLRVVAIVFLVAVILFAAQQPLGYGSVPTLTVSSICIALVLRSSVSELFTHGFLRFIDPDLHETGDLDPKQTQRFEDTIAHLINTGQHAEAIKLCEQLKKSGEVGIAKLEHTLEFLGVKQNRAPAGKPLLEASRLRDARDFTGAEKLLKSLLAKNPANDGAAIMLMRVYAEDLHKPELALKVLHALEKQPHVSPAHLEFARRSIEEWSQPPPAGPDPEVIPMPPTVDNLLEQGSLGSAVELIEAQIKEHPDDFQLRLQLVKVYAIHCGDAVKAEKIIGQLELASKFNPEQIAQARQKLKEWRAEAALRQESLEKPRPSN